MGWNTVAPFAAAKTSVGQSPEGVKFSYSAKYEGQCPECDLPIAIGQQCVKTTEDWNLHADCLPD